MCRTAPNGFGGEMIHCGENVSTDDYRHSLNSDESNDIFSLNYQWKDKPHRHVYDLCNYIDNLEARLKDLTEKLEKTEEGHRLSFLAYDKLDDKLKSAIAGLEAIRDHDHRYFPNRCMIGINHLETTMEGCSHGHNCCSSIASKTLAEIEVTK
jgi:hypothetical protein